MKTLNLPAHSLVTPEMVHKLDHLLTTAHPTQLKDHLTTLLIKYLEHEHDTLPSDFEDKMVNLHALFEFLRILQSEVNLTKG